MITREAQIITECRVVSDGTIATLIYSKNYKVIEAKRWEWLQYVIANHESNNWQSWLDAWNGFVNKDRIWSGYPKQVLLDTKYKE